MSRERSVRGLRRAQVVEMMMVGGGRAQNARWWWVLIGGGSVVTMKKFDAWWAVLRRGVLCAAVRRRTWMCPTLQLIAHAPRHVWLRIDGTAELPSSYVWRLPCACLTVASSPPSPLRFLRAHVKRRRNSTAQLGRALTLTLLRPRKHRQHGYSQWQHGASSGQSRRALRASEAGAC